MPATLTTLITGNGWPQCSRESATLRWCPYRPCPPRTAGGDVETGCAAGRLVQPKCAPRRAYGRGTATVGGGARPTMCGTPTTYRAPAGSVRADELPWKQYNDAQGQVDTVHRAWAVRGNVYWGRDWAQASRTRCTSSAVQHLEKPAIRGVRAAAARRISTFRTADPLASVAMCYYYGLSTGRTTGISGDYPSDSQGAKDGWADGKRNWPAGHQTWTDATAKAPPKCNTKRAGRPTRVRIWRGY